jgi:hypothetical protein
MPRKKIQVGYAGDSEAIPESRRFGGSAEADEAFNSRPIMDCHVGGTLVRDMPLLTQRLVHYDQTDEGFEAKNQGRSSSHISIGPEPIDKSLEERRDQLRNGTDPRRARNAMKDIENRYTPAGMKGKFLRSGGNETDPDYVLVKNDKGEQVKYKNMPFGIRPLEDVAQRNRDIRERTDSRLEGLTREFKENDPGVPAR